MSGYTRDKKTINSNSLRLFFLALVIVALAIFLTTGCGGGSGPSTDNNTPADTAGTGSVSFTVEWHTDDDLSTSAAEFTRNEIEDCSTLGIETITCEVYDASNNSVASGGPWPCADRTAKMTRIPAQPDLSFTILGKTADDSIIYQGTSETRVTIIAGETVNAGTIVANPFVPTDLIASAVSPSRIELAWRDQGAAEYRIYQDGALAGTSDSPAYDIDGLSQNTRYCYTVSAIDIFGNESGRTSEACATTGSSADELAPTQPTDLTLGTITYNQIDFTWTPSTDNVAVSGYRIYRVGAEPRLSDTTSFSDNAVQPETEYCYTVEAFDAAGNVSPRSEQVCATTEQAPDTDPPNEPLDLVTEAVSASQINLTWSPPTESPDVAGYRIYRNGQTTPIADTAQTYHNDVQLQADTRYCYTVTAYDAVRNESDPSVESCTTTPPSPDNEPPGAPIGLATNGVTDTEINLVWTEPKDNVGVTGYVIFRDEIELLTIESTTYRDPGLKPGTEYCYSVVAIDAADNRSDPSNICETTKGDGLDLNLLSSFSVAMINEQLTVIGDAAPFEDKPHVSQDELLLNWKDLERACLEFDIANAPASGIVTLQFEMRNDNAPTTSRIELFAYVANGNVNNTDYNASENNESFINIDSRPTGDWETYTIDISAAYEAIKNSPNAIYMGILMVASPEPVRYEIRNPRAIISPDS